MPSYPVTKDLFRFATLRAPEHLSSTPSTTSNRFVVYPSNITTQRILSTIATPPAEGALAALKAKFTPFGPFFTDYKGIESINPGVYAFAGRLFKGRTTIAEIKSLKTVAFLLTSAQIERIYEQLFYQLMFQESKYVLQACTHMLTANHIIQKSGVVPDQELMQIQLYKIVVPKRVTDIYKTWAYRGWDPQKLAGIQQLGIADYRRVEQEVCCYVPGEVSHIENILAREYKERTTRNLVRIENTTEYSRDTEVENLKDTATVTRNELNTEVANVLQQDREAQIGASISQGASATLKGVVDVSLDISAHADFANSSSRTNSESNARAYAEEVTKRALERVVVRSSERRTSKVIKEFEENQKHGFDNRGDGAANISGVYRWVDMVMNNRLVNYGKRLMIEFVVPEPAALYKIMRNYKPPVSGATPTPPPTTTDLTPPKTLADSGVTSPTSITRDNYQMLAQAYGVSIDPPPAATITLTKSFGQPTDKKTPFSHPCDIQLPPDYQLVSISGSYGGQYDKFNSQYGEFLVKFAGKQTGVTNLNQNNSPFSGSIALGGYAPGITGTVAGLLTGKRIISYNGMVTVFASLTPAAYLAWQTAAFNLLTSAYNSLLDAYNNALVQDEYEAEVEAETAEARNENTNPAANRLIETEELRRACIALMTEPFGLDMGKSFITLDSTCGDNKPKIPKITQSAALTSHVAMARFFEQAFEWPLMSYLFYPYYWAEQCDWGDILSAESSDPLFQAFLRSGMARVVVPVRAAYIDAALYYLETGSLWTGGGLLPESDNDLMLAIAEDLNATPTTIESEWQLRVPTELTLLQARSASLDEGGLPCCEDERPDGHTNPIIGSEAMLSILPTQ